MKKTIENSSEYLWGDNCKGWHLLNSSSLSVIKEIMPPNSNEVTHKHNNAQQFFNILLGTATFEIDGEKVKVSRNEGIHIPKEKLHRIMNKTNSDLEFLVISQPHSHGDRINEY